MIDDAEKWLMNDGTQQLGFGGAQGEGPGSSETDNLMAEKRIDLRRSISLFLLYLFSSVYHPAPTEHCY